MRLESVRELKRSLPSTLARDFSRKAVRALGLRSDIAARAASPASVLANYALGITARRKNDYRLAVRLQHRSLLQSELVDAIRRRASGEVDVRYIGRVTAGVARKRAATGKWYRKRQRPLLIGSSCGFLRNDLVMAGTLGCFVTRRGGRQVMILSNNHVLADEGRYATGGKIVQPGALDGGDPARDGVARLTSFVRFRRLPKPNYVDAAVAALSIDRFDPVRLRGIGTFAAVLGPAVDVANVVHKVGRTTGVRSGRVTAIELDGVQVEYDTGVFSFDNQIEIEGQGSSAFSDSGDSGSLIVNEDLEAVALLFAGSDEGGSNDRGLTYANPMRAVLGRMKLRLAGRV